MKVINLNTISFEEKIRILSEKEQGFLQGYVNRAIASLYLSQKKTSIKFKIKDHIQQ